MLNQTTIDKIVKLAEWSDDFVQLLQSSGVVDVDGTNLTGWQKFLVELNASQFFGIWKNTSTYAHGGFVKYGGGYYTSNINNNKNNVPPKGGDVNWDEIIHQTDLDLKIAEAKKIIDDGQNLLDDIKKSVDLPTKIEFNELENEVHLLNDKHSYQMNVYNAYRKDNPKSAELTAYNYSGQWLEKTRFSNIYNLTGHSYERDVNIQETGLMLDEKVDSTLLNKDIDFHSDKISLTGIKHWTFELNQSGDIYIKGGSVALGLSFNSETAQGTVKEAYLMRKTANGWAYERDLQGVLTEINVQENFALREFGDKWAIVPVEVVGNTATLENVNITVYGRKIGGKIGTFYVIPHDAEDDIIGYGGYADGASNLKGTNDIAYNVVEQGRNVVQAGLETHNLNFPHIQVNGMGWAIQKFDNDPPNIDGLTAKTFKTGSQNLPLGHFDGYVENPAETRTTSGSRVNKAILYKTNGGTFDQASERVVMEANVFNNAPTSASAINMFETRDFYTNTDWTPYINIKFQYQKKDTNDAWVSAMTGTRLKDFVAGTNYDFISEGRPDKVSLSIVADTLNADGVSISSTPLLGWDKVEFPKLNDSGQQIEGNITGVVRPDTEENNKNPLFTANDWLYLNLWNTRLPKASNLIWDRMMFIHRFAPQFEKVNETSMNVWTGENKSGQKIISVYPLRDLDSRLIDGGAKYLPLNSQGTKTKASFADIESFTNITLTNNSGELKTSNNATVYKIDNKDVVINLHTNDFSTNKYGVYSLSVKSTNELEFNPYRQFKNSEVNYRVDEVNGEYVICLYGNLKKAFKNRIVLEVQGDLTNAHLTVGKPKYNQVSDSEDTMDLADLPALSYEEKIEFSQIETNKNNIYGNKIHIANLDKHSIIIADLDVGTPIGLDVNKIEFSKGDGNPEAITLGSVINDYAEGLGFNVNFRPVNDLITVKTPTGWGNHPVEMVIKFDVAGSNVTTKGKMFGFQINYNKKPKSIFIDMADTNGDPRHIYKILKKPFIGDKSADVKVFNRLSDFVGLDVRITIRWESEADTLTGIKLSELQIKDDVLTADIDNGNYPSFVKPNTLSPAQYSILDGIAKGTTSLGGMTVEPIMTTVLTGSGTSILVAGKKFSDYKLIYFVIEKTVNSLTNNKISSGNIDVAEFSRDSGVTYSEFQLDYDSNTPYLFYQTDTSFLYGAGTGNKIIKIMGIK